MASIGCGSQSDSPPGGTAGGTATTQKKGVQQLQMQQNPKFVPMQQGSKLNGSAGSN
jgi:hypothetical protein